jgi:hypothetical protein
MTPSLSASFHTVRVYVPVNVKVPGPAVKGSSEPLHVPVSSSLHPIPPDVAALKSLNVPVAVTVVVHGDVKLGVTLVSVIEAVSRVPSQMSGRSKAFHS